jgi:hypothetical protein
MYETLYIMIYNLYMLETCCIIGIWVQDHLLREAWLSSLEILCGGTCTRLGFPLACRP